MVPPDGIRPACRCGSFIPDFVIRARTEPSLHFVRRLQGQVKIERRCSKTLEESTAEWFESTRNQLRF